MTATLTYLGLGGNQGDVESTFRQVIKDLKQFPEVDKLVCSPLYRSTPWGLLNQPDFLNCVIKLEWKKSLDDLLSTTRKLENQGGRDRKNEIRWGPRKLDIDLLIFGQNQVNRPDLIIPHPRMQQRLFVLQPLADLDKNLLPPGWQKNIRETIKVCEDDTRLIKLEFTGLGN